MALIARDFLVSPFQGEFCLRIVVESPEYPAVGAVAAVALRAQTAGVLIIRLVTCETGRLGIPVFCRQVTHLTADYCMQAQQWKARYVVVKTYLGHPAGGVVAGRAVASQFAVVRPISVVAINTRRVLLVGGCGCKQLSFAVFGYMARGTLQRLMSPVKRKRCVRLMIKANF